MKTLQREIEIDVQAESISLSTPFRISRGVRHHVDVVVVKLKRGDKSGYGECSPYKHYGETTESVIEQIRSAAPRLQVSPSNVELQGLMGPGAARNALDCALWDLRCQESGKSVWHHLGTNRPSRFVSAMTIGIGTSKEMSARASALRHMPLLKVKLDADNVLERLSAVRHAAPSSRIILDPNESWTVSDVADYGRALQASKIDLLEQPVAANKDDGLMDLEHPVPICADEACHTSADLSGLKGKYDVVNVKLDKTGGLTEALNLVQAASRSGFGIMVGCMIGSSWAMAPALLLCAQAEFIDLDGPTWLSQDRPNALNFDDGFVSTPAVMPWGEVRF